MLVFLGMLMFISTVAVVKFRHNSKYVSKALRKGRHMMTRDLTVEEGTDAKSVDAIANHAILHPSSIYRLSVPDITGKLVSLEKFQGMVTLIVNVACQ